MLLEHINSYFEEVGTIFPEGKDTLQYRVASLQNLAKIIISHFELPSNNSKKSGFSFI